jgi:hypothetical protein
MITECRNIYWNSTTRSVQVGDFLYQNPAQTIPAAQGYYSLNSNNSWALCDAEGLVINSGICPNIFTSSFGYVGTNGNIGIASLSGSICGFDGIQPSGSYSLFQNPIIVMTPTSNYVSGTTGSYSWLRESSTYPNAFFRQAGGNSAFLNYTGGNSFEFTANDASAAPTMMFNNDYTVTPNTLQSTLPILQNTAYTIDIWFKTSTQSSRNGTRSTLFSRKQQASAESGLAGYTIEQNKYQAGDLAITMTPTTGGGSEVIVATTGVYLGTAWKCLTITIDGTNSASGVKMYVNGALADSSVVAGSTIPNMQETNGISISPQIANIDRGDPSPSNAYFVGRIGRLAMYTGAANAQSVSDNYQYFSSAYTN